MLGKMERLFASKRSLKLDTVGNSGMWKQSISRPGRTFSNNRFLPGKRYTGLTNLEVVPSVVYTGIACTPCTEIVSLHQGSSRSWKRAGYGSLLKLFTYLDASLCFNSINLMPFYK